jgi:hypothetical protein
MGRSNGIRNLAHAPKNRSCWSHAALKSHREFLAANRYRDLRVQAQPAVRSTMLECLVEIEQTTTAAIAGTVPNTFLSGKLTAAAFLMILQDVTTWALTYFEPVRSWSVAEDFTPTEEQEGYGLIERGQRMLASDYRDDRSSRNLRDVVKPKVRGAALWTGPRRPYGDVPYCGIDGSKLFESQRTTEIGHQLPKFRTENPEVDTYPQ